VDLLTAHRAALDEFGRVVRLVGDQAWSAGTPCPDWTVRDLVNHLVNEQCWAPDMLRGARIAEVGDRYDGDLLGADPVAAWDRAVARAWPAWLAPDALAGVAHTSAGDLPVPEYGWEMTLDVTGHAWDLATALGRPGAVPAELAETLLTETEAARGRWRAAGLLATPVPVPDAASAIDRLAAALGRQPAPN
jgi:uncharacterized protein (TIGR03086 family)